MEANKWLKTEIGTDIWERKYRFNNETFDEWLDRISNGNEDIKSEIQNKRFLFAGRILSNRLLQNHNMTITYSNCFTVTPPEDNLKSIFETEFHMAETFKHGGGVGVDISKLRPNGAKVNNNAETTTGAISWADRYSRVTGDIGARSRRGATMITIDCKHPDLIEFINAKTNLNMITKANMSVRISDDFMSAVENDLDWTMEFDVPETGQKITKTHKAREIFEMLVYANWDYAEPGMLFWDTINKNNIMSEDDSFEYAGVNPCGEEPLPAGGSCLLGSLNLSEFVKFPFTNRAEIKYDELLSTVEKSVIALNEVLDEGLELLPLDEQKISVAKYRQIGLGYMGVADMFIKLQIRYGSKESLKTSDTIGFEVANKALETSALLAKEHGTFPAYNKEAVLQSQWLKENTTLETYALIEKYGLRNSQLLTCAPTGSISNMIGVSGGIEPIYNYSYTRKSESLDSNGDKFYKIYTPIVEQYMKIKDIFNESDLPEFFTNAMKLDYVERIQMQAVWQKHIDASISSTVNLPNHATMADISDIYMMAWKHGLKGITVFRDGCKRLGILTNDNSATIQDINGDSKIVKSIDQLKWGTTLAVSDDLVGMKKKDKTSIGNIHVEGWFDQDSGRLMEVWFSNNNGAYRDLLSWNARMMSAGLRTGVNLPYLISQMKSVDVSNEQSIPNIVAETLSQMQRKFCDEFGIDKDAVDFDEPSIYLEEQKRDRCPMCGGNLQHTNGCTKCANPECMYELCGL